MNYLPEKNYEPDKIEMPPLPPGAEESPEVEENVAGASAVVDNPSEPTEAPALSVEPVKTELETAKEKNFAALRQKAEKAERERDALLRRLQEREDTRYAPAPNTPPDSEDTDFSIAPDDLAEGKHVAKLQKQIKQMEQKFVQYEQRSSYNSAETRVRSEMPDYDTVVNDENIELLKTMAPELAESVAANPDLYSKAKSAYKLIKKFGIHVEDTFQKDRAVVEKNMAKPRPLASVSPQQGNSPLTKANAFANGLTSELAEQLRREMDEYSKMV